MKPLLLFLWFCLAPLVAALQAQESATVREASCQYLFVIDTSFSMARQKQALTQTISELILKGLDGQMQPGESFAMWTFNEQVYTRRFPLQIWSPEQSRALAQGAAQFLKSQRFEKQTRMERAIAEIMKAVKPSKDLTLILLSDGDTPVTGTPFDRSINLLFADHGRELRKAKKPFVTTLVAREGQLLAWAVNAAGESITIPDVRHLVRSLPPPALHRSIPSTTPVPTAVPQAPAVTSPEAKASLAPPKEPPALQSTQKPADTLRPAPTNTALEPPPERPPQETPKPLPSLVASQGESSHRETPPPEPRKETELHSPAPAPAGNERQPVAAPDAQPNLQITIKEPSHLLPSAEIKSSPPSTEKTIAQSRQDFPPELSSEERASISKPPLATSTPTAHSEVYLVLAASLLLLSSGLLFCYLRNRRPQSRPSLISRSLDNKKSGARSASHD